MKISDVLEVLPKGDHKMSIIVALPWSVDKGSIAMETTSNELRALVDVSMDENAPEPTALGDKIIALLLSGSVVCIDKITTSNGCIGAGAPAIKKYLITVS